jgi:hypothetical protein
MGHKVIIPNVALRRIIVMRFLWDAKHNRSNALLSFAAEGRDHFSTACTNNQ